MSLSSAFRGNAVITVRTAYVLLVLVIYVRPIIQRYSLCWTDLHENCRIDRTLAVDERPEVIFFDPSRDVAVATNFVGKIDLQYSPCSSHDIR